MFAFLKRLVKRYGFFRREPVVNWLGQDGLVNVAQWHQHPFFEADSLRNVANDPAYMAQRMQGAINMAPGAVKARRLAAIVRERNALKDELAKAIKQKKARAPIYAKLRALSVEELNVVAGR